MLGSGVGSMDLQGSKISRVCSDLEISRICSETEKISRVYRILCPLKPLASDQLTARALRAHTQPSVHSNGEAASAEATSATARSARAIASREPPTSSCAEHEEVYSRL